jgi:hypothetical protein
LSRIDGVYHSRLLSKHYRTGKWHAKMKNLLSISSLCTALLCTSAWSQSDVCYVPSDQDRAFSGSVLTANDEQRKSFAEGFSSNSHVVERCYRRALQRQTDFSKGKQVIDYGIQIGVDGKVVRVTVLRSDFNDAMLHACLGQMICTFAFNPTGEIQQYSQPLSLNFRNRRPEKLDNFLDPRKL